MSEPNTSGVPITFRLPGDLHSKLKELAWRSRTSMNHEVNVAIRAHLDNAKRKGAK